MNANQLQQQASQHFLRGEYKEAVTWYDRARQSNPHLTSNYWYLGLALLLAGEEAEGQAVWFSVLAEANGVYPNFETNQKVIAFWEWGIGNGELPRESFYKYGMLPANVEESDRHLAELVHILTAEGARCLHEGQLQPAEIIYRQLLEVDGDNAEFYYYLGNAIAFQGREDEAVVCWRRAVELKPDFLAVYQSLASLFYRLKEFKNAIPYYLKIVEIKPDCYRSYYYLGLCFCQVNKLAEGINCFRVCLKIQPDYSPAWGDLGISLLKAGKLEEAIASLQKTVFLVGS
jgi:tetratricopeptide (TPR) repeat protein